MSIHDKGHFTGAVEPSISHGSDDPEREVLTGGSMFQMSKIRTIQELVTALEAGPGLEGYSGILKCVDIPGHDLQKYCQWNEKRYTRTCIARTDDFELMLICYEPGQRTSIHDYDTEEAWVHPVEGTIAEERFTLN